MRILLVDHGCCDHPHTRVHRLRDGLVAAGCSASVCGPASVPSLAAQPDGLHGIHLHDVAAASRVFLTAVREGGAEAFLTATAAVPARILGLARETARQVIAEATDHVDPDVIFVLHAGILTDLAVETGAPVVVHVTEADLTAAAKRPSLRSLVSRAIGSCDLVVAADEPTAAVVRAGWLPHDATACEVWPLTPDCGPLIAAACRRAISQRRG